MLDTQGREHREAGMQAANGSLFEKQELVAGLESAGFESRFVCSQYAGLINRVQY